MKKYLFIVLLVGVCFGQDDSNEISLDEIRKIVKEWQPIISDIKKTHSDLIVALLNQMNQKI